MSTRGASKQRRDLINNEITQLRDMLPLPETARNRLSQLQIMSMACCFIRKSNYFSKLFANTSGTTESPFEFFQAMSGFLLITTKEGKLLYISENVTEFLGHSMVDMMTQGDSIYDIIDKRDHGTVQAHLVQGSNNYNQANGNSAVIPFEEITFFCRMNVSRSLRRQGGFGDHKVMHVSGRYLMPSARDHYGNQPVFMGSVTPLVTPDVKETIIQNNTMIFQTVHSLDMKYLELSKNGEHHFGYTEDELSGNSWYNYIHPEDILEAKEKHSQLIKSSYEMGCMLTIRLLSKHKGFIWVNTVMHIRQPFLTENGDPAIVCINHVIDPKEAPHFKVQSQLYSSHIARSPEFLSNPPSSSPPHTITQIPMEGEQYDMQSYGSDIQHTSGHYQAQFGMTTTPIHSGNGQSGIVSEPMPLGRVSMSVLSDSGNSNASSVTLSPKSNKTVTHLELINRLKRKLPQQCKPIKKQKMLMSENTEKSRDDPLDQLSFYGSAVISPCFMETEISGGSQSMLLQMHDRPVYAQLKQAPVALPVNHPSKLLSQLSHVLPMSPPRPMTPDSLISGDDISHNLTDFGHNSSLLTIDTEHKIKLPPSLLTPDSSPLHSPLENCNIVCEELAEQCVPSLIDEIANAIKKQEKNDSMIYNMDQPQGNKAKIRMAPQNRLPELDPLTIDSYFGAMDSMANDLKYNIPIKAEPCPSPNANPTTKSPPPYNPSSSALQCKAPSNDHTSSEDVFQMGEEQLANIVASVAGSIMDIVQRATTTNNGMTVDYMLIPNTEVESQIIAHVPEIKQEVIEDFKAEDVDEASLHQGEFINELHQLNQLAAISAPSYGDKTDLVDAIFNQTL